MPQVKRQLLLSLWCLAHDGNDPSGGEWLGAMEDEDGPSGRAVVVGVLAESADVIVRLVEACAERAKARAALPFSPSESQCAEAGIALMYIMAFDGGKCPGDGSESGSGAGEALHNAGILQCAASCLEAFGTGGQRNEKIISLVLTSLLVLRSGTAAADAVITAAASEAAASAAAAAAAAAKVEDHADGAAFEASQAAMKAMEKKQRRRQHEPEDEEVMPPPPPPLSIAELAESAAEAGGILWASRILEGARLPMLLLRTAVDDAQGNQDVEFSPSRVRNRILAAATIMSLDSAPQHEGHVGTWAMSNAHEFAAAQRAKGGARTETKGSAVLPPLASPAQASLLKQEGDPQLPLVDATYADLIACLGGLAVMHRDETQWGPGPALSMQLRRRRFHGDRVIVALAVEMLYSRDPAIVQYALVSLTWLSDERASARRAIVEMGAVPRIVDLCRVRPEEVPRHVTSVRQFLTSRRAQQAYLPIPSDPPLASLPLPCRFHSQTTRKTKRCWHS